MKLRMLLAHFAEVQNQMLFVIGGGWTEIGPDPSPFAIAATVDVPWDETNRRHRLELVIVDADGQPLRVQTAEGNQAPLQIAAEFDVGRPPGVRPGTSFTVPIAVNLPPIPMVPGRSYTVRGLLDGHMLDELTFLVRQQPAR